MRIQILRGVFCGSIEWRNRNFYRRWDFKIKHIALLAAILGFILGVIL